VFEHNSGNEAFIHIIRKRRWNAIKALVAGINDGM